MLADVAQKYFIDGDYNCAESVLLAANEVYGLGLDARSVHLVSAYGGGMGCGSLCGALAGSMAALGAAAVAERAHVTEGFKELCAGHVKAFEETLGAQDCAALRPKYFRPETRCLETVRLACDVLERSMDQARNA